MVITAGVKSGSLSKAFSTDIHHVFLSGIENGVLFEGDGDGPSYRRNQAVYGTLLITLLGSGFGPLENTQIGRIGGTNCEETTWTSDSSVSCKITTKFGTTIGAGITLGVNSESAFVSQVAPLSERQAQNLLQFQALSSWQIQLTSAWRLLSKLLREP